MNLTVPTLDAIDLKGKRVLVRVDFNVPMNDAGAITDDTRVRAALPTIRELLEKGGKPVLMSHLGRPKGKRVDSMSLRPVAQRLEELSNAGGMGPRVHFVDDCIGPKVREAITKASVESVVLLENVRFHPGDEAGDPTFAGELAQNGDVFVNDAFGSSHRDHASVCGVARLLPHCAGRLLEKEIEAFRKVLEKPERPYVAILGGAKVSDKLGVIDHLLERVNALLVGGGMAYTLLAAQGKKVGKSLVQKDQLGAVEAALAKAARLKVDVLLPIDHVCAEAFEKDAKPIAIDAADIPDGLMGLDIGPRTRAAFAARIAGARTLVWNGPMGVFEWEAFRPGTAAVGKAVADCEGYTVIGGGDSVAAIEMLGLAQRVKHISTGGGASLELLEGTLLPGIAVLQE
jgi:phosphoglycerate kinase